MTENSEELFDIRSLEHFEPTKKRCTKSTTLILSNSLLATGYLFLPISAKKIGIIPASLMIFLSALISMFSSSLILEVNNLKRKQKNTITELVKNVLGVRWYYFSLIIVYLRTVFAIAIYNYFSTELINILALSFKVNINYLWSFPIKFLVFLISMALSFVDYKKLDNMMFLSILTPLFLLFVLGFQMKDYMKKVMYDEVYFVKPWDFCEIMVSFGLAIFAFHNQYFFLSVVKFFKYENEKAMQCTIRSHYYPLFICLNIMMISYFGFGDCVKSLIIARGKIGNTDILMNIICLLLEINVVCNTLIRMKSNRDVLFEFFSPIAEDDDDEFENTYEHRIYQLDQKQKYKLYFFLFLPPFVMSLFISNGNITYGINILSMFFGIFYIVFLPTLLCYKSRHQLKISLFKKVFLFFYSIVFSVFFLLGTIYSSYYFVLKWRWS